METFNMTVRGMTCGSCVKHVEKTISAIAGVQGVKVDLGSGQVTIWGELCHKEKEILAALEEDGYQAEIHLKSASQPKSSSYKNETSCCCR